MYLVLQHQIDGLFNPTNSLHVFIGSPNTPNSPNATKIEPVAFAV